MADTQVKAEPAASVKEEQTPAVPASAGAGSGAGAGAGATAGSTSGTSAAAATPRPVPQIPLPPPIQKAEEAVAADKYDAEAWRLIFDHAQSKPIEYARTVYERFMEVFPTAGRYWKYYADHEERSGFPERTTEVLKRALVHTVNVDVWKFYVDFTARQKQAQLKASASPSEVEEARKEIQDAYKLALDNVGLALASFPLWDAYIKFLTEAPESVHFAKRAKLESLRKAFVEASITPNHRMEDMWRAYRNFEQGNPATASRLLSMVEPAHKTARTMTQELKSLWEGITHAALATPPTGSANEALQLVKWKRLIAFEKRNTHGLDPEKLRARIRFVFRQCLDCLRFYPEIWLDFMDFEMGIEEPKRAGMVLDAALRALPESHLIHFAAADFHEERGQYVSAKAVYDEVVKKMPSPLAFILYQRFARRALGKAEGRKLAARKVFGMARKRKEHCTHHVYIAAAMLEFHANKEPKIAHNIFELGMKQFHSEPEFILHYAEFLAFQHDDANLRLLFERVLKDMPPESAPAVWERFLDFETHQAASGGSLKAVGKVESRYLKAYEDIEEFGKTGFGAPGARRVHRYMALGLSPPCAVDRQCLQRLCITPVDRLTGTSNGRPVGAASTRMGADITTKVSRGAVTLNVPPFLEELKTKLPDKFIGVTPGADYVIESISNMELGPRPSQTMKRPRPDDSSMPSAAPTQRRRMDGAQDVYTMRKSSGM